MTVTLTTLTDLQVILFRLLVDGEQGIGTLANLSGLELPRVNRALIDSDRLQGYVRKEDRQEDGKRWQVWVLTEAGRSALAEAEKARSWRRWFNPDLIIPGLIVSVISGTLGFVTGFLVSKMF